VVQDDHLPLAERQGGQGVAQVEQVGAELRDHGRRPQAQQRPGPAAQRPLGHGGQVDRDPPHPGLGQVVGAHPRPAGERPRVRLLEEVLGLGQSPVTANSWPSSRR
jgi:hypothetical protein